jgi:hypothetical protein
VVVEGTKNRDELSTIKMKWKNREDMYKLENASGGPRVQPSTLKIPPRILKSLLLSKIFVK